MLIFNLFDEYLYFRLTLSASGLTPRAYRTHTSNMFQILFFAVPFLFRFTNYRIVVAMVRRMHSIQHIVAYEHLKWLHTLDESSLCAYVVCPILSPMANSSTHFHMDCDFLPLLVETEHLSIGSCLSHSNEAIFSDLFLLLLLLMKMKIDGWLKWPLAKHS